MDPARPGAYEWWYFDALSDDGRWALVVIFFLGSPMSPYYKAVVDGKTPDPRDWCGVFVSLHERRPPPPAMMGGPEADYRWRERAYAYNLYRGGVFSAARPEVAVGGSCLEADVGSDGGERCWRVCVDEPGLWRGRTRAEVTFRAAAAGMPPALPPLGAREPDARHNWVCVAPRCAMDADVALPGGERVAFHGAGYHDHNFGLLPFDDTRIWYWGRGHLRCDDGALRTAVFYQVEAPGGGAQGTLLVFGEDGTPLVASDAAQLRLSLPARNAYGMRHRKRVEVGEQAAGGYLSGAFLLTTGRRAFSEGPFYRRLPLSLHLEQERGGHTLWRGEGIGIGEVFRPAGLCGPVASHAMWSRIRRRRGGGGRS